MPRNQKLTRVIAGRTVQQATAEPGKLVIRFDDQSTMTVKAAGVANLSPEAKVKAVQEDGAEFTLQFERSELVRQRRSRRYLLSTLKSQPIACLSQIQRLHRLCVGCVSCSNVTRSPKPNSSGLSESPLRGRPCLLTVCKISRTEPRNCV
jgi:hypothetical protein